MLKIQVLLQSYIQKIVTGMIVVYHIITIWMELVPIQFNVILTYIIVILCTYIIHITEQWWGICKTPS